MIKNSFCDLPGEQLLAMNLPDDLMGILLSPFQYSQMNGYIHVPTETFKEMTDYISQYAVLMEKADPEWSTLDGAELVSRLHKGCESDLAQVEALLNLAKACAKSKASITPAAQPSDSDAPQQCPLTASLTDQQKTVMGRHRELKQEAEAVYAEMAANLMFFEGKSVLVKHSRGSFEARVVGVNPRFDEMTVFNLETEKRSTRSLHELHAVLEDEDE